jgi:O-antigen/teichoic acid export membrane protein
MASFIGAKELAAYNVLLQLGFIPMMVIIGIVQTYTSPDIYKSATCANSGQKKAVKYINFVILKILTLSAVAVGVSTLLLDFIFKNLVGEEYSNYSKFLPYFVIAGSLSGITGLLNVGVVGAFKPKLAGVLMLISVLSGLIIQMVLIVMYRFEGGIAGLVFSNLAMMLIFFSALWLNSLKINK